MNPLLRRKIAVIVETVAREYEVSPEGIMGPYRGMHVVRARHMAMWLTREMVFPRPSTLEIGMHFDRDHSTVLHAIDNATKYPRLEADIVAKKVAVALVNAGYRNMGKTL